MCRGGSDKGPSVNDSSLSGVSAERMGGVKMLLRTLFVVLLTASLTGSLQAQEPKPDTPKESPATPAPMEKDDAARVQQTGADRPAILLSATSEEATVKVLLRDLEEEPTDNEIEAGVLTATQQPALQVRPTVKVVKVEPVKAEAAGKTRDYLVTLTLSRLIVFGESSVALMHKGRQVETLRFFKTGLIVKPAAEGGFVARQGKSPLLVVLENVSSFQYESVRARLRFDDQDVCDFQPEFMERRPTRDDVDCLDFRQWTPFDIPRYAQVTLTTTPAAAWFVDPASGLARSGKRKGTLTLRFKGPSNEIYEQNVPLEIDFQPSDRALFGSILWVGWYLFLGAILSIFLRISLPNLKRRRSVKNQLNDVAKSTAGISTAVDSDLRVLLRVARLEFNETLRAGWWFGPNDGEFTQRVEQALPGLKKRIDAVRRLDAALTRKAWLVEQGAGPTRLEQIDELLDPIKESLKQDLLTDEDWVSVNQRLEAVRKLLREPTQTEREAIAAVLASRWQQIRDSFGVETGGRLKVPATLSDFNQCFPEASLLPRDEDKDGSNWVKSVGGLRADLQLTALELLREFQFLTPGAASTDARWVEAKVTLNKLLATPATKNLTTAKLLLRQLASGISEKDISDALRAGSAVIRLDPQTPVQNQKVRFTVRFLRDDLNAAAARELVSCHWTFDDERSIKQPKWREWVGKRPLGDAIPVHLEEDGWSVYHYFESGVTKSSVAVAFHDAQGKLIELPDSPSWVMRDVNPQSRKRPGQWAPFGLELVQLVATLLVPLATLASTTAEGATVGHWWQLVGIGFGADTIKNLITGPQGAQPPAPGPG